MSAISPKAITLKDFALACLTVAFIILPFWVDRQVGSGFFGAALAFATISVECVAMARLLNGADNGGCGFLFIATIFAAFCCAFAGFMGLLASL